MPLCLRDGVRVGQQRVTSPNIATFNTYTKENQTGIVDPDKYSNNCALLNYPRDSLHVLLVFGCCILGKHDARR